MDSKSPRVKAVMVCMIQGAKISREIKTTMSLGIKVIVCSLIWVAAWKMETRSPMISPDSNMGAEIRRVVWMAFLAISMTNSGVIWVISQWKVVRLKTEG